MPTVTKNLLIINVLMFFGALVAARYHIDLAGILGLHFILASDFNPAQLITYMFMHGGFTHIFFNMFALFMFGGVLERTFGPKRFLFFYIFCGIGAGLTQEVVQLFTYYMEGLNRGVEIINEVNRQGEFIRQVTIDAYLNEWTTVGASGAIYAILLAFGMYYPNERMFIFPLPFPIKAKYFVAGYALLELMLGLLNSGGNIAHFAHLGGMLFGFLVIMYWRKQSNRGGYAS